MKIYLDYIFLENLIVNTVIILETILLTNTDVSKKRRNLVIILDTVLSCITVLVSDLNNYIFHIIFSSLTLYILFRFKNLYDYFKKFLCYYLIYFIYIGMIIALSTSFNVNLENYVYKFAIYIISALILHIVVKDLWNMWKTKLKNRDLYFKLLIDNVVVDAFVDTGNNVKEPITNLNVIFLNANLKSKLRLEKYKIIDVDVITVNGTDKKQGYIATDIIVIKDGKKIAKIPKIILCFSLIGNTPEKYSGIIGYDTYLEDLNGGVYY